MISFQADVVIKFPEEDAPSTVQSKNIFVPKPEIQVQSKTKFMCRDGGASPTSIICPHHNLFLKSNLSFKKINTV